MVIVHEVATKKILPLIKGILIHELSSRGFSQYRISQILGITQPQVNKYLSKPIENYYNEISKLGFNTEYVSYTISLLVNTIINGYMDRYVILINNILHRYALEYVCRLRREICINNQLADPYIEYYREWLDRIVKLQNIYLLIPEVGSNIVYAPFKPRDYSDIIGLTGRIIRAGYDVRVAGEPMYGGSRHLARTLIIASKYNDNVRVAMNIAKVDVVSELVYKYKIVYSGPHDSIDSFWRNIEEKISEKPDILVDYGGYGLEPITYIYADRFERLESILREIITLVSKFERKQ